MSVKEVNVQIRVKFGSNLKDRYIYQIKFDIYQKPIWDAFQTIIEFYLKSDKRIYTTLEQIDAFELLRELFENNREVLRRFLVS